MWAFGTVMGILLVIALFTNATITSDGNILISESTARTWLWATIAIAASAIVALAATIAFVREIARRDDAAIAARAPGSG
jgi:hypothetical protein